MIFNKYYELSFIYQLIYFSLQIKRVIFSFHENLFDIWRILISKQPILGLPVKRGPVIALMMKMIT